MVHSSRPVLSRLRSRIGQVPALKRALLPLLDCSHAVFNLAARCSPAIVQPKTASISFAITAQCNSRCLGCRYARDFMTGSQIDLTTAKYVIDDAASLGIRWIRFYGGEPLMHRDLGLMIKHATSRGVRSWISTNALLLSDSRFKELRQAGLQGAAIGWYGCDHSYDWYAQRPGAYEVLLRNLEELRRCDGTFALSICWLLAAHTCSLEELHKVWKVAERFDAEFHVDIVHEDGALPYFTDGPDGCLRLEDCIPSVNEIVA